jgi:single-stranded-DNA-specific exonuclease
VVAEVAKLEADILITVDNGIASVDGVAAAQALGMTVLITDHHLPGETLPATEVIVNPNQPGCGFASKNLAGVGVMFYVLMALRAELRQRNAFASQHEPNLAQWLDIVALGTVADVVALDGNNRILVHQGLQRIRAGRCRPGIQALVDVSGRDGRRLCAADLGFALGPRLNAVGRLDDMSLGVACLLCDDINLARQFASEMDSLNQERKEIEQGMQQEALATLEQIRFRDGEVPSGIVLHRNEWHQGVVGLVASKVKEKYYRPVIAFAESSETELKGSGRSIPGVHLRDALELLDTRHPGLMGKFGGHAMAAGLTLPKANIEAFGRAFEAVIGELVTPELLTGVLLTDGELLPDELTLELAELIRASGPWGQAFPEPLFDGEFVLVQQRLVGEKHLKMMLTTDSGHAVDAIAFGVDLQRWPDASVKRVRLVYRLDVNEWRGNRSVQLLVEHLEAAGL